MKFYILKKYFLVLFVFFIFSCKNETLTSNDNDLLNTTFTNVIDFTPTSTTNQIVYHANYSLSYVEKHEQAEWVAYSLKEKNLKAHSFKRPYFIQDNEVTTHSADWRNYKKSGYDKGHLCPAADMTFSLQAYEDTFLTSNIAPQQHDFNSGIWNRLEQKTRYWADKYGEVYVVSGGILGSGMKTIGYEKVAVPNYFYKIIATQRDGELKVIAFLLPHHASTKALYLFVTSVDEIEKLTNIDFFPKVEDSIENRIERNSDYKNWSF